jgi:predicted transcriptional regulator
MTAGSVRLTNRELDVMSVLWDRGSASVRQVLESLGVDVGYTAILKVLQTLEGRGIVRHEREGRAYRYYPVVSPDQVGDRRLRTILNRVYRGSRELLIARLLDDEAVSAEELARIRTMLAQRLKEIEE